MTRTIRRTLAQYRAEQAALNLPRIRDDADRKRNGEWSTAAQYALDTLADGADEALADLDWLIAEADREERAPVLAWWHRDADRIAQGYQAGRS